MTPSDASSTAPLPPATRLPRPGDVVARIGRIVIDAVSGTGLFAAYAGGVAVRTVREPGGWLRWRLLGPLFHRVGVATIPVVALTGAFIGMVLALESYAQFASIGQEGRLGGIINIAVTKQIGPVLAAVMVAGRVGGALAAELGSMRVTEQVDALRAMGTDPLTHLVVPRVVACTLMTPLLTVYSNLLGVFGGWFVTVWLFGVPSFDYWDFTAFFIDWWDIATGLIKTVLFGAAIGLLACWKGLTCRPGAVGVGRAATEAFVAGFLAIIVINLVLAQFLNSIDALFIDPAGGNLAG